MRCKFVNHHSEFIIDHDDTFNMELNNDDIFDIIASIIEAPSETSKTPATSIENGSDATTFNPSNVAVQYTNETSLVSVSSSSSSSGNFDLTTPPLNTSLGLSTTSSHIYNEAAPTTYNVYQEYQPNAIQHSYGVPALPSVPVYPTTSIPNQANIPILSNTFNYPNAFPMQSSNQPTHPNLQSASNIMSIPPVIHTVNGLQPVSYNSQIPLQHRRVPAPIYSQPWNRSRASENKLKRSRTAFTTEQLVGLENQFRMNPYLDRSKRLEMASDLKLNEKCIKVWFQNRRMKDKKDKLGEPSSSEISPVNMEGYMCYGPNGQPNGLQYLPSPVPSILETGANNNHNGGNCLYFERFGADGQPQIIIKELLQFTPNQGVQTMNVVSDPRQCTNLLL